MSVINEDVTQLGWDEDYSDGDPHENSKENGTATRCTEY